MEGMSLNTWIVKALEDVAARSRHFVDRDGVKWLVRRRPGEIALGVPVHFDDEGLKLPRGVLSFRSELGAFGVPVEEADPFDFKLKQLQAMIDERFVT